MVKALLRELPVPLAATVKPNVPEPVPLALAGVSHPAAPGADAVQPQPALAVMSTLPFPPPTGCTGLLALKLKLHGNPAWVTVKFALPTLTEAERWTIVEFAAVGLLVTRTSFGNRP